MSVQIYPSTYSFAFAPPAIDAEEKEIMQRLRAYGIKPTGDKSVDKAKLRQIEEQKAKQEKVPSNKYLTISKSEQEKFIEKKKQQKIESGISENKTLENIQNKKTGQHYLGQQLYLAINMKKDKQLRNKMDKVS